MKNKGAGLILTILSILLAVASAAAYLYNCTTPYFATIGVNALVVGCIAAGAGIQAVAVILGWKRQRTWLDILPVAASAFLMAALIRFVGIRINEIAFIMTFQKTAANLADMQSAVVGIALCLGALLVSWVASFFDITKPATPEEGVR